MPSSPERPPSEQELRDLAALADGSLPPGRREAVEARVAGSPRLQALLAEQRRARGAILAASDAAPASLRASLDAERARRARPGRRRRVRVAAGLAAATACALALVIVLPGSESGAPTIARAAQLGARPAERSAPGSYAGHPELLDLEVDEVPYPNWDVGPGWRAVGSRDDRLGSRSAQTLFYERDGRRLAYTIVSGRSLAAPSGAQRSVRDGTELRSFQLAGRTVVTWQRRHHTCVLSGTGVSREAMLKLGAWKHGGAIPY